MRRSGLWLMIFVAAFGGLVGAGPDGRPSFEGKDVWVPTVDPVAGPMSNAKIRIVLEKVGKIHQGEPGYWQVIYRNRLLLVVTDEAADRMRIVTPVIESEKLEAEDMRMLLEANFESALDARYALYRQYLWSVFIHPLRSLREESLIDAMNQVTRLADTFGSSFSSTDLFFGSPDQP